MKVGSNSFSYLLLITIPVLVLVLANLTALSGQSLLTMKRFVSPRSKAKNKASEALATPTIITGPHAHETTPTNGNHQLQPDRLLVHRQRQPERLVGIQTTNDNNYQLQPDRLADALALLAAAPKNKVQTRQQPERLVNASPKLNGKFVRR